jgi:carbon storage regulator
MLILTRRPTETVVIGDNVIITVLDIRGGRVRIGVNAPREVIVNREEVLEKTRRGHRMPHVRP